MTAYTLALFVVAGMLLLVFQEMFFERTCPMCGGKRDHGRKCPFRDKTERKDT